MNKLKPFAKQIIICSLALLFFGIIALFANVTGSLGFDTVVYNAISSLRSDFFITFFKIITFLANKYFTIILVVVMAFLLINRDKNTYKNYFKNQKFNNFVNLIMPWLVFALAVLLATLLFFVFKVIFARIRPVEWFLVEETGYSFPSGHSATAVAMYGTLAILLCSSINKKWLKILIICIASVLSILIGISRIFLGVHYATDVLAGWLIGIIVLCVVVSLLKIFKFKISYKYKKS